MRDDNRPVDILPLAVLIVLIVVMLGAWWLFPKFQAIMARSDCVAVGHTNCG